MKRIRKEIRDLSREEWNKVCDAFWIMKTTSDDTGKSKYGESFVSYDTMVSKHITAGKTTYYL
jgi:hypothetical protein